ncbi:hypothetical protein RJT34_12161 [Clitoria ternatea]|uniref:Uncharacterized protein n=1 Tax=Clitoria ternatea TaxID=43366 RepID=A0AAN9JLA5_CLITE
MEWESYHRLVRYPGINLDDLFYDFATPIFNKAIVGRMSLVGNYLLGEKHRTKHAREELDQIIDLATEEVRITSEVKTSQLAEPGLVKILEEA